MTWHADLSMVATESYQSRDWSTFTTRAGVVIWCDDYRDGGHEESRGTCVAGSETEMENDSKGAGAVHIRQGKD